MSREERLARFAEKCPNGDTSHVQIAECSECGWLAWSCSTGDIKGYSVEPMFIGLNSIRCNRCYSAYQRAPEVAEWVMAVVDKLYEDIETLKELK